jgi:hypothetical protein
VTAAIVILVLVLGAALVFVVSRKRPVRARPAAPGRILFPFLAYALSPRALDAALRLSAAEEATLVPVFLARVPLRLPLDAPLPRQAQLAIPLQEAIEQRAWKFDVPVDSRVQRGRTFRHALRRAIEQERFDRIVIAAAARGEPGFDPGDVAWLLDQAAQEIVVLRPGLSREYETAARQRRRRSGLSRRSRAAVPAGYGGARGGASRG